LRQPVVQEPGGNVGGGGAGDVDGVSEAAAEGDGVTIEVAGTGKDEVFISEEGEAAGVASGDAGEVDVAAVVGPPMPMVSAPAPWVMFPVTTILPVPANFPW